MATEVGSAYVTLIPSAKGFASKMQRELAGDVAKIGKSVGEDVGEAVGEEGGKTAGSRFADTFKSGLAKVSALAGGVAIGAVWPRALDCMRASISFSSASAFSVSSVGWGL
jgi:hypothetical protein